MRHELWKNIERAKEIKCNFLSRCAEKFRISFERRRNSYECIIMSRRSSEVVQDVWTLRSYIPYRCVTTSRSNVSRRNFLDVSKHFTVLEHASSVQLLKRKCEWVWCATHFLNPSRGNVHESMVMPKWNTTPYDWNLLEREVNVTSYDKRNTISFIFK